MTKKGKTLLFILGGTVVDLLLCLLFVGMLFIALGLLTPVIGEKLVRNLFLVAFVGGIALAMLVYNKLLAWVVKKYNLEDKLEPMTMLRRRTPKSPKKED